MAPCISPWAYETIQRWTAKVIDPNKTFNPDKNSNATTDEALAFVAHLKSFGVEQWTCHIDCHETTDSDKYEFKPTRQARDGVIGGPEAIPDGFYLIARADMQAHTTEWLAAMIDAVKTVTHIAPPDAHGRMQEGVRGRLKDPKVSGLCAGVTNAPFAATTEVYPDSENMTAELCNQAQVTCLCAGLTYIMNNGSVAD